MRSLTFNIIILLFISFFSLNSDVTLSFKERHGGVISLFQKEYTGFMNPVVTNSYTTNENQLEAIFNIYLSECEYSKSLSPYTIKNYRDIFQTFQKIVPEARSVEDMKPYVMNVFFQRLGTRVRSIGSHKVVGVKVSTISTYYNKLMTFFKWMEQKGYLHEGYLTDNTSRPRTPEYTDERALNREEVSKIIASIALHTVNDPFINKRDMAMVHTLLYTGIRRGELIGLRVQDVHFHSKQLFINRETSKSKFDRYIPMNPVLVYHLTEYFNARKEKGITTPSLFSSSRTDSGLTLHGLKHWVNRYKKLSGVRFHLHRFRHTFACSMGKQGAGLKSIMKLLGHTTLRMTLRYLRSISTEDTRGFINELNF